MLYTYEASDKDGAVFKGEFEAENKEAVIEYLVKKGLIPVRVEGEDAAKPQFSMSLALFETVRPLDRILLVRNLAAALRAGLGVIEAIDILIADTAKNIMRNILTQAKINLENGQPLSRTFADYKKHFPPVFVGLVKAGEYSGRLDQSLEELSEYMSREYNLSKKITSALIYPIILLCASTGIIIVLLVFVLPRLTKFFKQSKVELPAITKVFVALGNIASFSRVLDVAVLVFLIWFFTMFRKTKPGRRIFLTMSMRIPVVKDLVKKIALVRLTRTLGSLIASGVSITEALRFASVAVANDFYEKAVVDSIDQVERGIPFSRAFKSFPELFPRFLTGLLAVGEKTGTIEHVLKTFSDFYDQEIDTSLKDLTNFLEPVLLLIMGVIIGAIALAVLLPIYQLVGSFK